jgi:two-component system sensor histidine kinase ArlS
MTLKNRIAFFISILFTLLFGIASYLIVVTFADFRKEEFRERLKEKALASIKMLIDVKEIDSELLKIIDDNSLNKLYDEKTLIFDSNYQLLYSSLTDVTISWTQQDLDFLKENKTLFKRDGDNEVYGVYYDTHHQDYYALISANDAIGKRKLEFLVYLVTGAYILFTILAWILTFYTVKRLLVPLQALQSNITNINENNLATRIDAKVNTKNEIDAIASEFNQMMDRLEMAYQKQRDFTAQASHELRTPLARMSAQLENALSQAPENERGNYGTLLKNVNQLTDLINSLLLLSKAEANNPYLLETVRIDEVIYASVEKMHLQYPDFKATFEISDSVLTDHLLLVKGNDKLMEIAISNLLKNAYLYSDNARARIRIEQKNERLQVVISNSGALLSTTDQQCLFESFSRGSNAKDKSGLGLGLKITQRILAASGFQIHYNIENDLNSFRIIFY